MPLRNQVKNWERVHKYEPKKQIPKFSRETELLRKNLVLISQIPSRSKLNFWWFFFLHFYFTLKNKEAPRARANTLFKDVQALATFLIWAYSCKTRNYWPQIYTIRNKSFSAFISLKFLAVILGAPPSSPWTTDLNTLSAVTIFQSIEHDQRCVRVQSRVALVCLIYQRLLFDTLQPTIGTNPISVSASGRGARGDSFQLDMATSAVAQGERFVMWIPLASVHWGKKKALFLSVNVFSTKVLIGDTILKLKH